MDCYRILGVSITASMSDIKKRYRELAIKYHPDKTGGDKEYEAKFKEISNAYSIIGSVEERKRYDIGRSPGMNMGSMNEMFRDAIKRRGASVKARIIVTIKEAILGTTKTCRYSFRNICDRCNGKGVMVKSKCVKCGGHGRVKTVRSFNGMHITSFEACRMCNGTGGSGDKCSRCNGLGEIHSEVEKEVVVPSGVREGQKAIFEGAGAMSPDGGQPGDLIVYFFIKIPDKNDLTNKQIKALDILC